MKRRICMKSSLKAHIRAQPRRAATQTIRISGSRGGNLTPPSLKTTPFKPTTGSGVLAPALNIPILKKPAIVNATQKGENSFYTNKADSGTISLPPKKPTSIEDFRNGIEELTKKIDGFNRQQYNHILSGDDNKVTALDNIIKNTAKLRDELKVGMAAAMGIGSENKYEISF